MSSIKTKGLAFRKGSPLLHSLDLELLSPYLSQSLINHLRLVQQITNFIKQKVGLFKESVRDIKEWPSKFSCSSSEIIFDIVIMKMKGKKNQDNLKMEAQVREREREREFVLSKVITTLIT